MKKQQHIHVTISIVGKSKFSESKCFDNLRDANKYLNDGKKALIKLPEKNKEFLVEYL